MSKATDSWGNEILGWLEIPLHHVPDDHTTLRVLPWECMVMVFPSIPASLGRVGEWNGT
jgi:hypothetical protein